MTHNQTQGQATLRGIVPARRNLSRTAAIVESSIRGFRAGLQHRSGGESIPKGRIEFVRVSKCYLLKNDDKVLSICKTQGEQMRQVQRR